MFYPDHLSSSTFGVHFVYLFLRLRKLVSRQRDSVCPKSARRVCVCVLVKMSLVRVMNLFIGDYSSLFFYFCCPMTLPHLRIMLLVYAIIIRRRRRRTEGYFFFFFFLVFTPFLESSPLFLSNRNRRQQSESNQHH